MHEIIGVVSFAFLLVAYVVQSRKHSNILYRVGWAFLFFYGCATGSLTNVILGAVFSLVDMHKEV